MGPSLAVRLGVSLAIGLLAGTFAYWYVTTKAGPNIGAFDFTWGWRAARALIAGQSPYAVIRPTDGAYPFDSGFKYPLPYAVLSLPFAWLSGAVAMAAFSGVGMALLAFGLFRDGYHRWPILVSSPVITCLLIGQPALWCAVGALVPALAWLGFLMKPQSALIGLAYRIHWILIAVAGTAGVYLACMVLIPSWPLDWIRVMFHDPWTYSYLPAIRILPLGPLLVLAAFKWKTPEGRMLLATAIVPQTQAFTAGIYAMFAARTYREALLLTIASNIGWFAWSAFDPKTSLVYGQLHQSPWVMLFIYLPALALVLRRPNIS